MVTCGGCWGTKLITWKNEGQAWSIYYAFSLYSISCNLFEEGEFLTDGDGIIVCLECHHAVAHSTFTHKQLLCMDNQALGAPDGRTCSSAGKESTCNVGDLSSIPGLGRSPRGGHGYPLQYSGLENSMDRGAWRATIQGVAKSWSQPSDSSSLFLVQESTSEA